MFCGKCGASVADDSNFCSECGVCLDAREDSRETATDIEFSTQAECVRGLWRSEELDSALEKRIRAESSYYLSCYMAFENASGTMRPTWNWSAFLFGPLWYLAKGMWGKALLIVVIAGGSAGVAIPLIWVYEGLFGSYDHYLARMRRTQWWVGQRPRGQSQIVIEKIEEELRNRNVASEPYSFSNALGAFFGYLLLLAFIVVVIGGLMLLGLASGR